MGKLDFDVDQMVEEVIKSKNTINDKAQRTAAQSAQTSVVMPETGARSKTSAKPQEGSVNMNRSGNKGSARPKSRGRNRKTNIGARGTSAFPVRSLGATMQDMKDPEMDKDLNKHIFHTGQLAMLGDCLSELIQDFKKATFTWKVNPANGMPFVRIENGTGCCLDMEIQGKDPDGTERIQYKAGGPIPRCQKHFNSLWEKPVTPTPPSSGNLSPIDKLVVENQQLTKYFWEFYHKANPKSGRGSSGRRPLPAKEQDHLIKMREALKGFVKVHATKVYTATGAILASINHNLKQLADFNEVKDKMQEDKLNIALEKQKLSQMGTTCDHMQADVEEDLLKFLRNVYLILNEIDDDSLVAEFAQYWPALIKEAKIQKGSEITSKSEEIFENLCLAGEGELDKWLKMNFGHKINEAFGSFEEFTKSINSEICTH